MGSQNVNWIYLAQDTIVWRDLMNHGTLKSGVLVEALKDLRKEKFVT
jgi:hypothetical protein